jgi:hypothetical protein
VDWQGVRLTGLYRSSRSAARSCQWGFIRSISLVFLLRTQLLISFSPLNCVAGVIECFAVDEAREVVAVGEAGRQFVFVLEYSARQVTGDSCIEYMGSLVVCHYVDRSVGAFAWSLSLSTAREILHRLRRFRMTSVEFYWLGTPVSVICGHWCAIRL